MNVSGIDVGYKTVVVAISKNGKQGKQRTFENTPSGHQELKKVPHSARVTRVGLEATGVYHPELAVALHESNRFELMVIFGNKYLRKALYMPALSAARTEEHVRGYYQHLIEDRHLKKIQAVCAVMRKLLHAIHAMLSNPADFDGSRFYSAPARIAP